MSINGIPPGGGVPPNNNDGKKPKTSADNESFDKELKKVQAENKPVEPTDKASGPQNILPIQPNYHVLSQLSHPTRVSNFIKTLGSISLLGRLLSLTTLTIRLRLL